MVRLKIGVVLGTNENAWNAFRFAVKALDSGHTVRVFVLGPGGIRAARMRIERAHRGGIRGLAFCASCHAATRHTVGGNVANSRTR